jgi:hypothetical protein
VSDCKPPLWQYEPTAGSTAQAKTGNAVSARFTAKQGAVSCTARRQKIGSLRRKKMTKPLDCPKCGLKPEKWIRYDVRNSVIMQCACGCKTKIWRYADIEYCAVDEAIKDWNQAVRVELKRRKNNENPQS